MAFSFLSNKELQELRNRGIVPYSPWISRLIALALIAAYYYFSGDKLIPKILEFYLNLFASEDFNLKEVGKFCNVILFDFILFPSLLILLSIFVGGLAQTRFYLKFGNLVFNLGRLGLTAQLREIKPIKRILFGIAFPILFFILIMLTVSWAEEMMTAFSWSPEDSQAQFLLLFKSIASQIAIIAVLLILLATILNWFYFRIEHRSNEHDSAEDSANQNAIDSIR